MSARGLGSTSHGRPQWHHMGILGSFKTEDDAAKVVARKLGRPKASLLRIPKNKIISERIGMCIGTVAIEAGK